ncbi:hypothetical protein PUN28_004452 [Cardiocondyla obscurior]|uniref:Ribosomal protein S18 n=1 Tax=Cardiocondyla obscurior TaxID=286306 RepID=A0AAW2GBD7_9HYME
MKRIFVTLLSAHRKFSRAIEKPKTIRVYPKTGARSLSRYRDSLSRRQEVTQPEERTRAKIPPLLQARRHNFTLTSEELYMPMRTNVGRERKKEEEKKKKHLSCANAHPHNCLRQFRQISTSRAARRI